MKNIKLNNFPINNSIYVCFNVSETNWAFWFDGKEKAYEWWDGLTHKEKKLNTEPRKFTIDF